VVQTDSSKIKNSLYKKISISYHKTMKPIESYKMDKTKLSISSLSDESDEKCFWQEKLPHQRLEALEMMRQIIYGYDPISTRLQRVLTIVEQAQR
jgi:hypothetical protein